MDISTTVAYIQLGVWIVGGGLWAWNWLTRTYPRIWALTVNWQWAFSGVAVTSVIALGLLASIASLYFNVHRPPCLVSGKSMANGMTIAGTMSIVAPSPDKPEDRVYTDKTPADFAKFYSPGFTELQSDALMKPFIGLWVHVHGRLTSLTQTNPAADSSTGILQYGDATETQIYCEFPGQAKELSRLSIGDQIKVDGKITGHTNLLLELNECVLAK